VFGSVTHYFTRKEQLPGASDRDINVVAANSVRAGFDFDFRSLTSRVSARYLQGRKDLDFNTAGNPQIRYEDFAVVDLNAVYHLTPQHSLSVAVSNLFDRYYYEKLGFPLPGRTFTVRYGISIGGRPESRP
jgi:outer membrane cobalamin receptor